MRLTKCEKEMMEVFWASDTPLSQPMLLEQAGQKSWKDSSVYILLNGLLEKGMLRETGFFRRGKAYARLFEPAVSCEDYCVKELLALRKRPELTKLFSALLAEEEALSEQMLDEMEAILQQSRQRLKKA